MAGGCPRHPCPAAHDIIQCQVPTDRYPPPVCVLPPQARAREAKQLSAEFSLKSQLEQLKWDNSVKKANVSTVRSGLGAAKAPIPSTG